MAHDLSKTHEPVTNLFPAASNEERLSSSWHLSDDEIAFFHEHGYLANVKILEDDQIEQLRRELATFLDASHDGRDLWYEYHVNEADAPDTVLFHALGAWRLGPSFHDLLWNPAFTVPAAQLLGGPVRFWHDQLFCKPAHHGGVVAWHQDYSYWTRTQPMAHLTCWIALDDSDRHNGCIQYVPGSHRWELLPVTGLAGDMNAIRNVLTDLQWEQFQSPVAAEVRAGHATFHHPLTIHGSNENRTNRPRRATVLNVVRDGVRSASDEPLLFGVPPIASDTPLDGQFFPLLSR